MKTAGRENPNRWATVPRSRAHGAEGQNRSCSNKWAAKQETFQPQEMCFFLTSAFIELSRTWLAYFLSFLGFAKRLLCFHREEFEVRKTVSSVKSMAEKIQIEFTTRR